MALLKDLLAHPVTYVVLIFAWLLYPYLSDHLSINWVITLFKDSTVLFLTFLPGTRPVPRQIQSNLAILANTKREAV